MRFWLLNCGGVCTRRQGTVVSIVTPAEQFVVRKLARQLSLSIPQMEISHGEVVLSRDGTAGVRT